MGTKVMLIGLLVIGTIAMLETDVMAGRWCDGYRCLVYTAKELEKVLAEVKKNELSEVWLIGFTDRVGSSKEFDRVERKMEEVRQTLIQRGLQPDIFSGLILEGYAPRDPKRKGIKVIVILPYSGKDKR
jgi:hypothetical protein